MTRRVVVVCIVLLFPRSTRSDDTLKNLFLKEYAKEAQIWLDRMNAVSGAFDYKGLNLKVKTLFARSKDYEYMRTININNLLKKENYLEDVTLLGPHGFFFIKRNDKVSPFHLRSIGKPPLDSLRYENYEGNYVTAPLGSRPTFLFKQLTKTTFELIDVVRSKSKPEWLEVTYKFGGGTPKLLGNVTLDTSNHRAVVSQEIKSIGSVVPHFKIEITYEPSSSSFMMPKTAKISRGGRDEAIVKYHNWSFEALPESDFFLSKYGLENIKAQPEKNNLKDYFLCFLLILMIISIALLVMFIKPFNKLKLFMKGQVK